MRASLLLIPAVALGACAAKKPELVEIGRLVFRDSSVVIHSTDKGVVYSVYGPQGETRARQVSLAELKREHPRLGRIVDEGIAWASE